jgi:hypothetical protein
MTTPSTAQKRFLAAGAKIGSSTWGTAEALGAGFGGLIDGDGGLIRSQPYNPANEADTPFVKEGDLGPIDPVDFSPEFFQRYDPGALGILLAQLFGTAGSPSAVGAGFAHILQWKEHTEGQFSTFAIERASKIFEVPSVKPISYDLSIADGFVRSTIGLRGNTLINDSGVNGATEMDALTYADRGNRVKFSDLTVYLVNEDHSPYPEANDIIVPSDISMHFERPHDGIHGGGSDSIIEPAQNGQAIITIEMTFPRMNAVNATHFADFIGETEQEAYIWFSGAYINGVSGQKFEYHFYFPRLRVTNVDYPFDEIVPSTMTLQAEEAASNPGGFSHTVPYLRIVNNRSTDYLA